MPVEAADLMKFIDRQVTVQVDTSADTSLIDDFIEVTGKCVAVSRNGMVISNMQDTKIIKLEEILDVEEASKKADGQLTRRRWLREVIESSARQHLLDRHGYPFDLTKGLTPDGALKLHQQLDHSNLGHVHGVKPAASRGRPRIHPIKLKPETVPEIEDAINGGELSRALALQEDYELKHDHEYGEIPYECYSCNYVPGVTGTASDRGVNYLSLIDHEAWEVAHPGYDKHTGGPMFHCQKCRDNQEFKYVEGVEPCGFCQTMKACLLCGGKGCAWCPECLVNDEGSDEPDDGEEIDE